MNKNWVKIAILAVLACLCVKYSDTVFHAVGLLFDAVKPLLLGFVIAYALNIVLKQLEKRYFPKRTDVWVQKSKRAVCVFASVFLLIFVVVLLLVIVIPALGDSIYTLMQSIPKAFSRFQTWLSELADEYGYEGIQEMVDALEIDWNELYQRISSLVSAALTGFFSSAFTAAGQLVSLLFNGIVALIFAAYLLFNKEKLLRQVRKLAAAYLPGEIDRSGETFLRLAHSTFTSFISGQVLEAIILGTLCAVGMLLIRLPYAILTGVVVGVTALIPVVGAYIGAFVGAFLILTESPMKALVFLVYIVILQQIETNGIYPRVVGSTIGLPGLWVLAAVTVGGGLFGVAGMLIGVPLTATVYKWLRIDVNRRLRDNIKPRMPGFFRDE